MSLRARTVFEDLGYEVVADGGDIEARRGNKHVEVVPVSDADEVEGTDTRHDRLCFVADGAEAGAVKRKVEALEGVDAAVIGLDGDDYTVVRSP